MRVNFPWLCVFLIVFAPSKIMSGRKGEQKVQQVNLTNAIDELIPYVSEYMVANKMDPLNISDVHQSFCMTNLLLISPPICMGLTYSLSSGLLRYLSHIKRRGPVTLTFKDRLLTIDAGLTFDRILVSYNYFLELLFLHQHGKLAMEAHSIWANIGFTVNFTSCEFALKKFKLTSIESIRVSIKESSLINQLIIFIANIVLFLMKNVLMENIEGGSATALGEAFKEMNEAPCPWNPVNLVVMMYSLMFKA